MTPDETALSAVATVVVHGPGHTRRAVIGLLAAAGTGGLLVGCGSDDEAATTGEDPTPAGESPSETESSAPAAGAALVAVADVPVGGGVILEDPQVVVTQPTEGTFKAFSSICTHQKCPVTKVEENVISCPCHGSMYSATDGSVQGGPAPAPLAEVAVTVEGDQVVQA